jgi:hypothetical protein
MDARLFRAALVLAAVVVSAGAGRPYASVRSQHFIVSAPTQQLATEICQAAEQYRRELAIEWLGHELPQWNGVCPIKADVSSNLGAGGATSFVFQNGTPGQWTMSIQGSRERILDSVLPHEITHTIFATHFGRPLPRWADEGACTTVEHESEKTKQDRFLVQFLTTDRGIPFNRMFVMKEYPPDILPLYSQGYSLARFFIQQGGKQKYVQYVGEGMRSNNWTATTKKFYGFNSLSDLQLTWVEWVRGGSQPLTEGRVPEALFVAAGITNSQAATAVTAAQPAPNAVASSVVSNTQMASLLQQPQSRIPDGALSSWQTVQAQNARVFANPDADGIPPAPPSPFTRSTSEGSSAVNVPAHPASYTQPPADYSSVSRPVSEGWYTKRRDQAQAGQAQAAIASSEPQFTSQPLPPQQPAEPTAESPVAHRPIEALPLTPVNALGAEAANQDSLAAAPIANRGRVLLEWSRPSTESPAQPPSAPHEDTTGIALHDRTTALR